MARLFFAQNTRKASINKKFTFCDHKHFRFIFADNYRHKGEKNVLKFQFFMQNYGKIDIMRLTYAGKCDII
jgi:hypothetical protein